MVMGIALIGEMKMGKFKDLTGLKFGKLTVIEQAGHDKYNKILWKCKCDCGNETITHGKLRALHIMQKTRNSC